MSKRKGFTLIELLVVLVLCPVVLGMIFVVPVGYVLNVVALVQCDFEPSYKAEIIHGIGIVVIPVGVVVGWIGIDDVPDKPGGDER